jgi:hypothetical protein
MIFSDAAVSAVAQDQLGRSAAAEALYRMLSDPALETPLTVGVFGGWGTGKTSLMRLLQEKIVADKGESHALPLWFDAWAYARQETSLWRALLLRITGELGRRTVELVQNDEQREQLRATLDMLETSLYRSQTIEDRGDLRVNWSAAMPFAADLALRYATAGLSDMAKDEKTGEGPFARFVKVLKGDDAKEAVKFIERESRERYIAEVRSLEQFRRAFQEALKLANVGADGGQRLFLFVDDLDRCLPDDAVAAIEAIKLFLDFPGCVFVLGMDSDVVETGIRARYAKYFVNGEAPFRPGDYLDKVIQVPFRLPPLSIEQVSGYLDGLAARDPGGIVRDARRHVEIAVPDNPRALKRTLNVLRLAAELDGCGAGVEGDVRQQRGHLAKIVLLQICFPEAYRHVVAGGHKRMLQLEMVARGKVSGEEYEQQLVVGRLKALLDEDPFFEGMEENEFLSMLTLSRTLSAKTQEAK